MNNNVEREQMFGECIKRLELLKLDKSCIKAFKEGYVWESENYGALYELNEKEKKIVEDFEKENGSMVYHVIHNFTNFGEMYNLLYVSKYVEEWEQDIQDLKDGYALVYVKNMDNDFCSEFGSIAIKQNIGGLVRIG